MLKSIDIWKKLPANRIARYRCFEILGSGGYCVQSADFFTLPVDDAKLRFSEKQFLELLLEEAPRTRCAIHATREQAIQAHEREFAEIPSSDGTQLD